MKRSEWELRDQAKFVVSLRIDKRLHGVIYLWSNGLSSETVQDFILVGVSKIEEYREMITVKIESVAPCVTWFI